MNNTPKIWQISELNAAVKELIEDGFFPLWISGEIGNLTVHRSGHVYFTLKDERGQVNAIYFSGSTEFNRHRITEGCEVEAFGKLTVYEARGTYQLSIQKIRPKGIGLLMAKFEELKNKLLAEGLFDDSRKKKIPLLPQKIAVITSPEGAAIRDFLNIIQRRFANIHIRIFPCAVQGELAAQEVAKMINLCNKNNAADVIIITRGGGSLEDLWAFNEEIVARAISLSNIPIISAIGHEVDFTICDFVADLRVPTPSAAAELVIGQKVHYQEQLNNLQRRLTSALILKISHLKRKFERLSNSYVMRDPLRPYQDKKQYLDDLFKRMENSLSRSLEKQSYKLDKLKSQLELLNPQRVLERGYAIVSIGDKVATDEKDIPLGEEINVRLANGTITAERKA